MSTIAHIYTRGLLTTYEKSLTSRLTDYPIVILKNNQVVDYCERAKKQGVKPGMLKKHATYNLPAGMFLNYQNDDYYDLTQELLKLLSRFSPQVEIYNGQEFFIDLTGETNMDKIIEDIASLLVPAYCEKLIISLAKTKLTSRACSLAINSLSMQKWGSHVKLKKINKNAIKAIVTSEETEFLAKLPVKMLWPLKEKAIKELQFLGLNNCNQVQEISPGELGNHFGSQGILIHRYSNGIDCCRVKNIIKNNQLIRYYHFQGCSDRNTLEKIIHKSAQNLADELGSKLEGFRKIKISFIRTDGIVNTKIKQFNRIMFTNSSIKTNLIFLLKEINLKEPIESLIICLKDIQSVPTEQLNLFDLKLSRKKLAVKAQHEKIARVIENLNQKFPAKVIKYGKNLSISRREQVLQLWDPYRFAKKEVTSNGETGQ